MTIHETAQSRSNGSSFYRRSKKQVLRWSQRIGGFLILVLVWESFVRIAGIGAYILPSPSLIIQTLLEISARLANNAWYTGWEILIGFLISASVGIPIAIAVAFSRFVERTVYPIVLFFQIIPKIAIAPLFIIWFGFGFAPKVMIVCLLCFFPIVLSTIAGFKSIDDELIELAKSTGASKWRTFFKIRLPHALPSAFTGLKVAAAMAGTAAVVAEFVASDNGLGYLLLIYNGNLETAKVFAVISVLSVMGLAFYYIVEALERAAIPWHVAYRNSSGSAPPLV
jgi:NitT/TauT family transport system permease protein